MITLQFVPYGDIEFMNSEDRVKHLLNIVKGNKIVLMQGRLKPEEETKLIQRTMEQITRVFKGIEICTIFPEERNLQLFTRLKKEVVKMLSGDREGITIIGPASVVKEIRRDPNKIQLFTHVPSGAASTKAKSRRKKTTRKRR